mmetsp:Transcript_3512/g.7663  ORF Transcript_3512/g.7663 Transcript_3512/m.7663 type:complete len:619 (+) Transcript_3512:304-2160(+)|eukprot:CAMPEP_0202905056 /NCGR_PEP_ID=MMETSP1392-20130828/32276_1 /ASSEMBLY_ACC=CAM_ASM_000868 /TAXON_ID=225041 /ORGANISM="Chlamydomonas chlamydogama, Strain SAG 11-48b" /LENGTH=618 /DNA_ID=CAMNT_0049592977 /DNA_START=237 /DNA_END=2093 /DNA_ORIENTATION=+
MDFEFAEFKRTSSVTSSGQVSETSSQDENILGNLASFIAQGLTEIFVDPSTQPQQRPRSSSCPRSMNVSSMRDRDMATGSSTALQSHQHRARPHGGSNERQSDSLVQKVPDAWPWELPQQSRPIAVPAAAAAAAASRGRADSSPMPVQRPSAARSLPGSPDHNKGLLDVVVSGISTLGQKATDLLNTLDANFDQMFNPALDMHPSQQLRAPGQLPAGTIARAQAGCKSKIGAKKLNATPLSSGGASAEVNLSKALVTKAPARSAGSSVVLRSPRRPAATPAPATSPRLPISSKTEPAQDSKKFQENQQEEHQTTTVVGDEHCQETSVVGEMMDTVYATSTAEAAAAAPAHIAAVAQKSEAPATSESLLASSGGTAPPYEQSAEHQQLEMELQLMKQLNIGLQEENARLRAGELDPLIDEAVRRQLELLLAEKARLLEENARLSRENESLQQLLAYTTEHSVMVESDDMMTPCKRSPASVAVPYVDDEISAVNSYWSNAVSRQCEDWDAGAVLSRSPSPPADQGERPLPEPAVDEADDGQTPGSTSPASTSTTAADVPQATVQLLMPSVKQRFPGGPPALALDVVNACDSHVTVSTFFPVIAQGHADVAAVLDVTQLSV